MRLFALGDRDPAFLTHREVDAVCATGAGVQLEAVELPSQRFFLATAFQPQVGSSESRGAHALIEALLRAARERLTGGNGKA